MSAGGFLGGLMGGYAKQAGTGKRGLLRRKKKQLPLTPSNSSNTTPLSPMAEPNSFKKGGRVKKGGWARVHKGEVVVPKRAKKRGKKSAKRR